MSQPMNPNPGMHPGGMMPGNPQMLANNPNSAVGPMPQMVPMGNVAGPNMTPSMASASAPIMNNPQSQVPPSQGSHQSSSQQQQQQQQHQDSISRVKFLVAQLKKSMTDLIEVAASNINHNSNIDNGQLQSKSPEDQLPRFDKALEDFYSICNQLELCLRTILECAIQTRDSSNYLPFQISKDSHSQSELMPPNLMTAPDTPISYTQYLGVIKKQVNYAKAVYDILSESVRQIKQTDPPPPPQQMAPQQPPTMNPMSVPGPQTPQQQPILP